MNQFLHNVETRPWYGSAMRLSELEKIVAELRLKTPEGQDPRVVGVYGPHDPKEARIVGIVTRQDALEHVHNAQLNTLGGDVTEIDIDDTQLEVTTQLRQGGDVIYVLLGVERSRAAKELYDL